MTKILTKRLFFVKIVVGSTIQKSHKSDQINRKGRFHSCVQLQIWYWPLNVMTSSRRLNFTGHHLIFEIKTFKYMIKSLQ